jgi:hypothetical protein
MEICRVDAARFRAVETMCESSAGTVQSYARGRGGAPEHDRNLRRRQPVPCDEAKDVPVVVAQGRHGATDLVDGREARHVGGVGQVAFRDARRERVASRRAPQVVPPDVARHREQPRRRIIHRDGVQPTPRDREHLGDEIVGVRRVRPRW